MRKFLYSFVALCVALMATSCLYGKGFGEESGPMEDQSGFKAEASASVISANGDDVVTFRAIYNGEDVTSEATLYDAGTNEALEGMSFSTIAAGVYTFYITYGEYKSKNIVITAVMDIDLSDKEEEDLTATFSTNLVQVGKNYAAFILRYNGKVISADEIKKVVVYNAADDSKIEIDEQNTIGSEFNYVAVKDENGKEFILLAYSPNNAGSKSFWVGYKTKNTRVTPLTITAVTTNIPSSPVDAEPSNMNFKRRVMVTQLTGISCGFCPWLVCALHKIATESEYSQYADKYVHTAVHGAPYDNVYKVTVNINGTDNDLGNLIHPSGYYPWIYYDFIASHSGGYGVMGDIGYITSALDSHLKTPARAAIAARTELKDNMLLVRASVKVSHTAEYYVGAWLLESNLYSRQSNNTEVKEDYIDYHENVVRIADSYNAKAMNFTGHSLGSITKGEKADHLFVMELDPRWKVENCHLVIFVSTVQYNSLQVTNVVKTASLTSGVDFEYSK